MLQGRSAVVWSAAVKPPRGGGSGEARSEECDRKPKERVFVV